MICVVEPNLERRIELPDIGPVPRPLEVGRDVTGFERLSLRGYRFDRGHVVDGEAEGDEVAIVLVQGAATIDVADAAGMPQGSWPLEGRTTPWAGPAQGVYLPPGFSYRLHATATSEVAYARSPDAGGRRSVALHAERAVSDADEIGGRDVLRGAAAHLTCEETYVAAHRAWRGRVHHDAIWWVRTEQPGSAVQVGSGRGDTTTCFDGAALALSAGAEFQVEAPDGGLYLLRFGARAEVTA